MIAGILIVAFLGCLAIASVGVRGDDRDISVDFDAAVNG